MLSNFQVFFSATCKLLFVKRTDFVGDYSIFKEMKVTGCATRKVPSFPPSQHFLLSSNKIIIKIISTQQWQQNQLWHTMNQRGCERMMAKVSFHNQDKYRVGKLECILIMQTIELCHDIKRRILLLVHIVASDKHTHENMLI